MAKITRAKVLLLDDDLDLLELIQDYFKPRGYDIIAHSSAEQGVNEIIQQSTSADPIDLVLTDFRLPNMSGIEFIEQLKRVAPEIPIILITAHGSLDLAVEAIEKGAFDFVVKPIQFPQLSISMERAVYFGRLQRENQKLKNAMENSAAQEGKVIARSQIMRSIIDLTKRVAKSDATVLITGESGTGKEVLASLIHATSRRAAQPFVAINCSAIPEALLESELFGHAKGSFTGADDKKMGLFEEANGGTLFLDEIGDLSLPLQAKLLRVIQEWKIKRVGENQYRDIDVRLIAATHKNLSEEVREKRFREDLFFRLNVIPIKVPSLRERREDILPLADYFLKIFKIRNESKIQGFSKKALQFMLSNEWKGNVRELENAIERAVVLCESPWIEDKDFLFPTSSIDITPALSTEINADQIEQLLKNHDKENQIGDEGTMIQDHPSPAGLGTISQNSVHLLGPDEFVPLETLELRYIKYVLDQVNGVKDRAAKILQVDRKTLYRKLEAIENRSQS